MDYFNSLLPVEISLDILARLPTESVLDSKLVCTRWTNIVSNHPSFSKLQFHHCSSTAAAAALGSSCKFGFLALTFDNDGINPKFYYFEYNEEESITPIQRIRRVNWVSPFMAPRIVGSHNGLICLAETIYPVICICNPITRESVILPKINRDWHGNYHYNLWTNGFGYVPSTNEYKVLVVFFKENDIEVHIYTLGKSIYLSLYDKKNSTSKRLVKFRDRFLKVNPHRNTFISLKELGEEDTKVMESIEIEETKSHQQLQDEDEDPEYIYL